MSIATTQPTAVMTKFDTIWLAIQRQIPRYSGEYGDACASERLDLAHNGTLWIALVIRKGHWSSNSFGFGQ
jgi:hypothetical protein